MDDTQIIAELREIMTACGVGYSEVSGAVGTAPATVRQVLLTGRLPARIDARRKIARFVDRNRAAKQRSDLRFV